MTRPANKMVLGFNHNVKYKERVFHVQSEDSGLENPHIITHLFLGGNILASRKTSYAHIAHDENVPKLVRAMMEEQHKEMLRSLIRGAYDEVIEKHGVRAWQPGALDAGAKETSSSVGEAPRDEDMVAMTLQAEVRPSSSSSPPKTEQSCAPVAPLREATTEHARPVCEGGASPQTGCQHQPDDAPEVELCSSSRDGTLEGPKSVIAPTPIQQAAPPSRAPTGPEVTQQRTAAAAGARPSESAGAGVPLSRPLGKTESRASSKPKEEMETIFGEDLISERSLDEVILSYLSEDGNDT